MQDLKKQASDVANQATKKGQKYSDSTQKEALKKLQSSQGYASQQLEAAKKEADAQYKSAQVSLVVLQMNGNLSGKTSACSFHAYKHLTCS